MRRKDGLFTAIYAVNNRLKRRINELTYFIMYIYQQNDWPKFHWDSDKILPILSEVRNLQGKFLGKIQVLGFEELEEAELDALAINVVKSNEIEGEDLDLQEVRSSLANKLGIEIASPLPTDRSVDGLVEMMLDATRKYDTPISEERLFGWHAAMFPNNHSGINKIIVANWRDDSNGPMQVISGAFGREKIHYKAPDAEIIPVEMKRFIKWFNDENTIDSVLKAAIAHLWFVTIHPFEDGNGRIARALTDMLISRSDKSNNRYYSMSAQIRVQRKEYYDVLEITQNGDLDISQWILWFLECMRNALIASEEKLAKTFEKAEFWRRNNSLIMNDRQKKMINMIINGFDGKLTSGKWAKITKCSSDTALRDIQDLIEKNILKKDSEGGRNTNYLLRND